MSRNKDADQKGFGVFLATHKKWWLLPIVLMLGLLALLVFQDASGPSPFSYTLF